MAPMPIAAEYALPDDDVLFVEAPSRFIVEVSPDTIAAFEVLVSTIPHACIGNVTNEPLLHIRNRAGNDMVHMPVAELEAAFCAASSIELPRRQEHQDVAASSGNDRDLPTPNDLSRAGISESFSEGTEGPPIPPARRGDGPDSPPYTGGLGEGNAPAHRHVRCLILHANGTNRDREAYVACVQAGAEPEIVHINQLLAQERRLLDYHMLVVPGGFSYGDDLGAGTLWAHALCTLIGNDIEAFIASGRPVLGICNGFQTLLKAGFITQGILPETTLEAPTPDAPHITSTAATAATAATVATLAPNESGHFECRWVYLRSNPASPCLFTQGLDEPIYCPVAHGEGRLVTKNDAVLQSLHYNGVVALTYATQDGASTPGYPANPNGSVAGIAGLCNRAGNVLGMMPHPEDHIFAWQHPRWSRGEGGMLGLRLFENGVKAC